mgnify:FL=1
MNCDIEKEKPITEFKINPYSGVFIDIEGVDGSGESTQIHFVLKGERERLEIAREISNIIRVHPKFSSLKTLM